MRRTVCAVKDPPRGHLGLLTYLGVRRDGLAALSTSVGTELVEAFDTAVVAILLNILLPLQGVPAVVAVKLLSHGAHLAA